MSLSEKIARMKTRQATFAQAVYVNAKITERIKHGATYDDICREYGRISGTKYKQLQYRARAA